MCMILMLMCQLKLSKLLNGKGKGCHAEIKIIGLASPFLSATCFTSKLHPLLMVVFHCCFNTFSVERLVTGIILYLVLSY